VWRTAATNVGVRPTFVTGRGLLVEAFILDFAGDIYGKELRLQSWSDCGAKSGSRPSTRSSSRWIATSNERGAACPKTCESAARVVRE
jgi:hypothetical protein